MTQSQGLIDKAAIAGEALADLLTSMAGKPAREIEQLLLGLDRRLTGPTSPIPDPLRGVVGPLLSSVIRAVALAPDAIADTAEATGRTLTGDEPTT